jgi:NADH-quinone oxidoreductase subunit L
MMMLGTLAITGVGIPLTYIGFAGFLSKDAVIEVAFAGPGWTADYAFWLLVISALFTSFYSWRLIFLTFFGEPRGDRHTHEHAHESPKVMLAPLGVLALGAIFAGMIWVKPFFGHANEVGAFFGVPYADAATLDAGAHGEAAHGDEAAGEAAADAGHGEAAVPAEGGHGGAADHHYVFTGQPGEGAIFIGPDNTVLDDAHEVPKWVKVSPFIAMLIGFATAFQFYIRRPDWPRKLAESQWPLYQFLLNKWYFDEIYDFLFVRPARWVGGFLWTRGDGAVIDGGINGLAMGIIPFFTRLAGRAQSGYIFTYAFAMVIGVAILITWMMIAGGAE